MSKRPNAIGRFQSEHELDDEQLAELLSERMGRPIGAHAVRSISSRKNPPPAWLEALGLAPTEPEPAAGPIDTPSPAAGSGVEPLPLPFDPASARTQLIMLYTFGGKGAATVLHSPEVEGVWTQAAPAIADAYIDWARQSETVARVINTLTLGGPAGQVVLLHASLLASTMIVSGRLKTEALLPPGMRPPPERGEEDGDRRAEEPPAEPAADDRERPVRPVE